ncbi:MAG TPA: hypothetical protein VE046_17635 [Steroidobacteraceae bacterium]|nr:hypothetical protein [Steroidobacteraceae bacterium]
MNTAVIRPLLLAGVLATLAACATTQGDVRLAERLDERTGITVTTLDHPLEFFSPLPEKGLEAASFADTGLAETNRMGTRSYYLWVCVLWGRYDPHRLEPPKVAAIDIDSGGETLSFRSSDGVETPGHVRLYKAPADWSDELTFALTPAQVRALSHASAPTLRIETGAGEFLTFSLWKPPTATLPAFADELLDGAVAAH